MRVPCLPKQDLTQEATQDCPCQTLEEDTIFVNEQTTNCTAWPPPSNVDITSVADCEFLSTCYRESAGRMYRKSTFLSACTPSCQQTGADLNRLKLPRDCRTACKSASCLSGLQTRLQALHAALRACIVVNMPCFDCLLPLLRHFCTHCKYHLSIGAAGSPNPSEDCGQHCHLPHSHAMPGRHQHSESLPQVIYWIC